MRNRYRNHTSLMITVGLLLLLAAAPLAAQGSGRTGETSVEAGDLALMAAPQSLFEPAARPVEPPPPLPKKGADTLSCQKNNPDRLDCSSLEVGGVCEGPVAVFTISNTGETGEGDMRAPTEYRLIQDGVVVESGSVQLSGGATMEIRYEGGGEITLETDQQIGHPGNSLPRVTLNCGEPSEPSPPPPPPPPTEEPTLEPPPTEEPPPELSVYAYCEEDGSAVFVVENLGGDMPSPAYYQVLTLSGEPTGLDGDLQLMAGERTSIVVPPGFGMVELWLDGVLYASIKCSTPTQEPPPPPPPTEEPPPPPPPTEEPPPPPPTEEPLSCQKNNPDRLDCSSLEVTGFCDGNVAVFTIYNDGEAGEGDMRAPTQYRLIQNGVVIESGSVQLGGHSAVEVRYAGGGEITLQVDQQVGHPGGSLPTETLNCGG